MSARRGGLGALAADPVARLCLVFLAGMLALAALAPWVAPFGFAEQDMDRVLLAPNAVNWLGTDGLGRDLFSRLIHGGRVSLALGLAASLVSLVIGSLYGALAGWVGGPAGSALLRVVDVLAAIPAVPLLILTRVAVDAWAGEALDPHWRGVLSLLAGLVLLGWGAVARVARNQVLVSKSQLYVEAARATGATAPAILWRHIFPNTVGPLLIIMTLQIPGNILWESFLSFIGLGLQPPYSSWGVLAAEGWRGMRTSPHLMLAPGGAIFLTALCFNILGDALRDLLDPRTRGAEGDRP